MRTYRLPPRGFPVYRRTLIRNGILVAGLVLAAGFWLVLRQAEEDTLPILLVMVPFLAVVFGFAIRKAIRQQKEIWSSVEIRMDDGAITRSQLRIPELLIRREELATVRESAQGLIVKSTDRFRSLLIPRLLDPGDYTEIREDLATWVPIEAAGKGEKWKAWAFMALLITGFAFLFASHNPELVAVVALGLVAIYVGSAWRAYRQEGVDPKTRKTLLFGLVFLILFAAGRIASLLGLL